MHGKLYKVSGWLHLFRLGLFRAIFKREKDIKDGKYKQSINALSTLTRARGVNRGPRKVDRDDGDNAEKGTEGTARPH